MKCASFILLFFISTCCVAQISSDNKIIYTRKDGLSDNTISAMVKDVRGFLWIGTGDGLTRFDGKHFTAYFSDPGISTLSGNNIYDILQYQPGQLLIATNNGLSVLNTFTGQFENEKVTLPALRKGSGIYVRSLFKDNSGNIYVNYAGEIDVFTNDLRFLYRLTDTDWGRTLKGIVISFEPWLQDSKGQIWIPSANFGICIVDEKARQVYNYSNNPLHYGFLRQGPLRAFYYDEANGQVFLSYLGYGLEKHEIVSGRWAVQYFNTPHSGEARTINAITRKGDRLICCGGQRIYSLDPVTMQYEYFLQEPNVPDASSFVNCSTVLNDTQNMWIGTETRGLIQISYRASLIRQIALPYTIPSYPDFCTSIFRSPGGLFYFAYGEKGLIEVNERDASSKRYLITDGRTKPLITHRICADTGNNLLIGTSSGFFLFNTETKVSKRAGWLPATTDRLNVSFMLRDGKGNIWASFAGPNALGYYDRRANTFHYYPGYQVSGKTVFNPDYVITRMLEDKEGRVWMISFQAAGGLTCYDAVSGEWRKYPVTGKSKSLFTGKELNSICVTGNTVWTGNIYGLGLVRYEYVTDSIRRLSRRDGLLSDNILSISKDRKNNLFVCTMAGVNYLNTTTNEIRILMADDGNVDWGFAFVQFYDSVNNELVYGLNDRIVIAKNGLWEAPPDDTLQSHIDDIRVNNKIYPSGGNVMRLTHSQRNISIHFTSINYNSNAVPVYAYKMSGVDKDWNIGQEVTTTNYSNLFPGSYTFMVKAKGQSGVWGPVNDSLRIVIMPALWQTAWFWIIIIVLITVVLIWLISRRISHIRKSAQLKQKLAETEMMALRAQMNPHFIFNCLSAIDNLMQTNQADRATTYLNSFARLIRSVLENSKNNMVPFHKDIETLQLYLHLEQFRASNKFSYELKVDDELVNGDYKVPPLILQPFVENAIQHGLLNKQSGERRLSIHARLQDGFIQYIIADNGVGRVRAGEIKAMNRPEHKSYGIQITTERLQLHNQTEKGGDIVITDLSENGLANGTRIEVRIKTD
jgi:ligand-binding sensor domain-containing protein/two-component sensor histidine kinase